MNLRADHVPSESAAAISAPSPAYLRAPSLRRRMACWLYEGTLLFGVVVFSGLVFSIVTQSRHALQHRQGLMLFEFLVLAAYFVYFWRRGQTLAMKTWHIRVVDRTGQPLSRPRALLRFALCWVWFLPPLAWMASRGYSGGETAVLLSGWALFWALLSRFQREQQFWHDVWAGTRLIDVQPDAGRRRT